MFFKKNTVFFSKMHGLGNDFVLIDSIKNNFFFSSQLIQKWSHRYLGIGFDQLLILQKSICQQADFHYRIFNSNGLEVEQCGNGARCIAYYLFIKKKINKKKVCVSTKNRYLFLEHVNNNIFKVDMGEPIFTPKYIPFTYTTAQLYYSVTIDQKKYIFSVVSMGNPHCVIQVDDITTVKVNKIGLQLSQHILFPEGVNVGFMQILSKKKILLRVYERHVGETQACGSGACAAVAAGIRNKNLTNHVTVILQQGCLKIDWTGFLGHKLYMSGEAQHVYDGIIHY
ncbi:Diaminopimelate epimerase [Buchnera aphidicola (Cinara kochiana kochiana)]|uniref:Diaminopimelate epimerase n=1 Tax=Buchnera aphidicola (Cinara kochiana kochiana) TaxID=2518976 RepID=A0A451D6A0_9GAMM|nr:Diaminopimelate epimerase [Buchnera aphidicola (Cinara kochiana kochiana)]